MFFVHAFLGAVAVFATTFVLFPLPGQPNYLKKGFDASKRGVERGVNNLVALAKTKAQKQTA